MSSQLMIDEELRVMAELLAGHVSAHVVDELLGYVMAGEAKVGIEQLCDTLSDEEEPLTSEEAALIRAVGTALGVTRASFRDIDELVADGCSVSVPWVPETSGRQQQTVEGRSSAQGCDQG